MQDHENFCLASILDPRFKLRWCTEAEKDDLRGLLCQKVSELNSNGEVVQVEQQQGEAPEPQCKRKRLECSQLFQFMSTTPEVPSTDSEPAESELRSYFDSPSEPISSNPLIYWSNNKDKYKRLCVIAQNVLALPASSAPVERLFSIAGKVFRLDRCRLAHNRFSHMMFIRCNNHLI